jgi:type II secretory pathway component HofQ
MRTRKLAAAGLLLVAAAGVAALADRAAAKPSDTSRSAGKRPKPKSAERPRANADSPFTGEPISLDLKDADLKDVLKSFAELAKINIAVDPEVKGSVTIRLRDVPWDQALDVILRTNGFGYVLEGNVLRVGLPAKLLPQN